MPQGTRLTLEDLIQEVLSNTRIHPVLLDYLARREFRSQFKRSSSYKNMISSLNYEALEGIYHIFVKGEKFSNRPGKAEEWKLANYMLQNPVDNFPDIDIQLKIDHPLPAKAGGSTHKIDVVLLYDQNIVLAIGEAKATGTAISKGDIAKWFTIIDEYLDSPDFIELKACYYLSLSDYKEDALRTVKEEVPDSDRDGWGSYARKISLIKRNKVKLKFIEERGGRFYNALS